MNSIYYYNKGALSCLYCMYLILYNILDRLLFWCNASCQSFIWIICKRYGRVGRKGNAVVRLLSGSPGASFIVGLINICIALYPLCSSFVRNMFCKCSNIHPCRLQLSPRCIHHCEHWKLFAAGGRNRCTHNKVSLHLHLTRRLKVKRGCIFTTRRKTGSHLSTRMVAREPWSRWRGALSSVELLSCCSLAACKMASVPTRIPFIIT